MSASNTHGSLQVVPQPLYALLTRTAIFLTLKMNSGVNHRNTICSFCADLSAIFRAVEFRDLGGALSCVMGFASEAWDQLFGPPRPAELLCSPRVAATSNSVSARISPSVT